MRRRGDATVAQPSQRPAWQRMLGFQLAKVDGVARNSDFQLARFTPQHPIGPANATRKKSRTTKLPARPCTWTVFRRRPKKNEENQGSGCGELLTVGFKAGSSAHSRLAPFQFVAPCSRPAPAGCSQATPKKEEQEDKKEYVLCRRRRRRNQHKSHRPSSMPRPMSRCGFQRPPSRLHTILAQVPHVAAAGSILPSDAISQSLARASRFWAFR